MIDYAAIRTAIVQRLKSALGISIIMGDQTGQQPAYPFVTYKMTSPYLETSPHGVESVTDISGGIKRSRKKQVELVFSFTAHAKNPDEAYQKCYEIIDYFDFSGRDALRDAGIVVVGVSNAQNRDVFLTIEYERRVGVDVRFRVVDSSEVTEIGSGYIEKADIEYQGG
ncbi:hypothetical protein IJ21_17920 [Paenibacillus sp. 32O-W]|uniref:phage neck terminator protein n=1 Tax=Paenibacillus sp. 32O-W TaxID=1695218 RepID=UPI00071FD3D7|nr:hypothetical protein [Paenibacillus sp. 32O-W]ALS27193.1 hypothetical protein IJ21_17920 [Paenibacillus sp. 32O-W]